MRPLLEVQCRAMREEGIVGIIVLRVRPTRVRIATALWNAKAAQEGLVEALRCGLTAAEGGIKALLAKPELVVPPVLCIVDNCKGDLAALPVGGYRGPRGLVCNAILG